MKIEIDKNDTKMINEFIGQVLDIFEDFLEEKGVIVPNDERDQDPDSCIIYGSDYMELHEKIKEVFVNWPTSEEEKEASGNV